jgi:Homing endonuclease associated repeat
LLAEDVAAASKMGKAASPQVFLTRWGTWRNAMQAAGLRPTRRSVPNRQGLIAELQSLAQRLGHTPTTVETAEASKQQECSHPATYQRVFGSWPAALEEAGLTVVHRKNFSPEELIQQIHRLYARIGRVPSLADLAADETAASSTTFYKHFGSWKEALRVAGLNA